MSAGLTHCDMPAHVRRRMLARSADRLTAVPCAANGTALDRYPGVPTWEVQGSVRPGHVTCAYFAVEQQHKKNQGAPKGSP